MYKFLSALIVSGMVALGANAAELPEGLKWKTAEDGPVFASPNATQGGTFTLALTTYPLTLRTVGPDSNTVLYTALLANNLGLTGLHPNTRKPTRQLALEWAFGDDQRSVYYKLDPSARWSDGEPVTADDFAYTMEFMRSKEILAPWYNTYYTEQIEGVTVFDDHTFAVTLPRPKPDMLLETSISPTPRHFYGDLGDDFIRKYNWKIAPNTGPYQIDKIKRGKSVTFKRKKDWWANERPFFKNRFNVNRVVFKVIREQSVQWEHFKNGQLDAFSLADPIYWHDKSKVDAFEKGYANKLWFYTDAPQPCTGIWLNSDAPILRDVKVREGIAHAMNFQKLIDTVLRGEADRLEGCTQGYGDYTNPDITARRFDEDKANALLDEAGWNKRGGDGIRENENGQRLSINLLYGADLHLEKLVVLREEARKAGLELDLQYKDWAAMVKQINANKHQANFSGFGARGSGIPSFWGIWHGVNANKENTNNNTNINDPVMNDLIIKFRESSDRAERVALSRQIQDRIDKAAVYIPGYVRPYFRTGYWRWWRLPEVPATKTSGSAFDLFDSDSGGLFWYDEALEKETRAAMKSDKAFEPVTRVDETYRPSAGK